MDNFKNSKLIVKNGKKVSQLDSFKELVEEVFGRAYFRLSANEKRRHRYEVAYPKALFNDLDIAISDEGIFDEDGQIKRGKVNIDSSILIDDDMTMLLSLAQLGELQILEDKSAGIFTKWISVENFKDNYINVNKYASEIMGNYLAEKSKEKGRE